MWTKGQSGNPAGRPRAKRSMADELRAVGSRRARKGEPSNRKALAAKLWAMAIRGNIRAARLIFEYLDGKAAPTAPRKVPTSISLTVNVNGRPEPCPNPDASPNPVLDGDGET